MNFEFDPFRQTGGHGEAREANRFLRIHRAAGVRQQQIFLAVDEFQNVRERIALAAQIGATQSDGDDLRPARLKRVAHRFRRRKLSRPDHEAGLEFAASDDEWAIRD